MADKKEIIENKEVNNDEQQKECFVIMPISDPDGYAIGHFERVYNDIFIPAILSAGFKPFRVDEHKSSSLIQLEIIRKLIESPMAICDLSSRNPNVLFELGVRQAFDKPVVLINECGTQRIFDISSIKTIDYRKERKYDEVLEDQNKISMCIAETYKSRNDEGSINSIVKLLQLKQPALLKNADNINKDPTLQFIMEELSEIKSEMRSKMRVNLCESVDQNKKMEKEIQRYISLKSKVDCFTKNGSPLTKNIINEIQFCRAKYQTLSIESADDKYNDNYYILSKKYNEMFNKYINSAAIDIV